MAKAASSLELFLEGSDIELVAPRAPILMRQVPERVGNRRRLEQVFVLGFGPELSEQWHIDTAIDVHICDMDALWMKVARHHFSETSHCKLGRRESRGGGPWPDTGGRASDQNRAAAARQHFRHDLPRP